MYCRKCGRESEKDKEYCENCLRSMAQVNFCPFCGKETVENARFCEHCGAFIKQDAKSKPVVAQKNGEQTIIKKQKTCKNCYSVIPESAQICPKCHKWADRSEIDSYKVTEGNFWAGFFLGFVLGFIGFLIALAMDKSETKRGAGYGWLVAVIIGVVLVLIVACSIENLVADLLFVII